MKNITLYYDSTAISADIKIILETLQEEYPIYPGTDLINIRFVQNEDKSVLVVSKDKEIWTVSYGQNFMVSRGIALVLSGRETESKTPFESCGILMDCTRGNIMTVSAFKNWVRKIAMMGCNRIMLYVKDAYQLPDEPYFGYMRGAYSLDEIKQMDCYAQKLGVELSAAIQVLGHLEPIMRWPVYQKIRDTYSAIMVDEPESYKLIEKMLIFWREALSSSNIHIGMDETFDLGRGRFMDINGYESSMDIFNRHLQKVTHMCSKLGLKPMIWSDMYFRYANKTQEYYDVDSNISTLGIPDGVQFSYWDYYHRDVETYEKMLLRTAKLNGSMPLMASGIWTWLRMWADFEMTRATVSPCLEACKKLGVKEFILTMWGDDGAYCDFNSSWASLVWAMELVYGQKENKEDISKLFEAIVGDSWKLQILCGSLCHTVHQAEGKVAKISADAVLWDDPLLGITCNEFPAIAPELLDTLLDNYQYILANLANCPKNNNAGNLDYAWNIANVLSCKLQIRKKLMKSYKANDITLLQEISSKDIPTMIDAIESLKISFRTQWLRNFKHFGLEINQIRLAGLAERYQELARVIDEFISGKENGIPALDVEINPAGLIGFHYRHIATGNFFI